MLLGIVTATLALTSVFGVVMSAMVRSEIEFMRARLVGSDLERAALLERLDALRVPVTAPSAPVEVTPWLTEQGEIDANELERRERLLMENQ